ncbi:Nucleoside-diphosphate-sugar epimerase [Terribacillus saccharophilus]|uniref:Nucleoside-diphosphate-sugar epimerase n=1 Tax=Terribacillus saccharophilus TaxID=361277 RepID=A0AAX2EFS5_9BACI|nr:SDR family oxidoreductase [Terribacillus saccharophilus]MEC0291271.1 SDR family oxidoreductase [Terribacillus saccharophilus]SEN34268.1 Nucleoside-diphosphate-sugar epimerase [Terribacillus saccharophilus]
MKALFIGGTGTISSSVTELALQQGWELFLLNRGSKPVPEGCQSIIADITDEAAVAAKLQDMQFDVVADFISFSASDIERDVRLFADKTKQFIFVSSASAYQKPPRHYKTTESTPLVNPYWEYSQDKIKAEEVLQRAYRDTGLPVTIVRPSHTYGNKKIPVAFYGAGGSWQIVERIKQGKPVLVHGDGTSLWTLTHNTDFAKGFVGLMGNPAAIGETVHITSDEVLTWNSIYDIIGDALGKRVEKVHVSTDFLVMCRPDLQGSLLGDKAECAVFDNSKIKRLVPSFTATKRFDQGVREAIENMERHPDWQRPDPEFDQFCDMVIEAQKNAAEQIRQRLSMNC